ncbi:MAG: signal peptide peptidase SppA [Verrucomicrobiota bacterium]
MENETPSNPAAPPPISPPVPPVPPLPPFSPPPRPTRRSNPIWKILTFTLAGLLLLVFLNYMLGQFGAFDFGSGTGAQTGRHFEEVVVENNRSGNKVLIVDVEGIITSQAWDQSGRNMVNLVEDQLKLALRHDDVKAVVLKVDSPGGEVLASDDISRAIINFQKNSGKPVVASMGGLAASGGYYVSAPCRWIVANELTITGSIGVIMHSLNFRGLLDKVGVYPQVFKSGKFKDMLSSTKKPEEITPEEQQMIQSLIDETYEKFKSVVASGRQFSQKENQGSGRSLAQNWVEYADGRVLTGKQAYDLGFIDELGNFETAVSRAKKLADIKDANLVRYLEPFNLANLFNIFGKSESKMTIDFGVDLPKIEAGRLYFISPTLIH